MKAGVLITLLNSGKKQFGRFQIKNFMQKQFHTNDNFLPGFFGILLAAY